MIVVMLLELCKEQGGNGYEKQSIEGRSVERKANTNVAEAIDMHVRCNVGLVV